MRATAKFRPNQKKELGHSLAIGSLADGPSDAKFAVGDTRMHEAAIFCFPGQTNPNFAAYQNSSCKLILQPVLLQVLTFLLQAPSSPSKEHPCQVPDVPWVVAHCSKFLVTVPV